MMRRSAENVPPRDDPRSRDRGTRGARGWAFAGFHYRRGRAFVDERAVVLTRHDVLVVPARGGVQPRRRDAVRARAEAQGAERVRCQGGEGSARRDPRHVRPRVRERAVHAPADVLAGRDEADIRQARAHVHHAPERELHGQAVRPDDDGIQVSARDVRKAGGHLERHAAALGHAQELPDRGIHPGRGGRGGRGAARDVRRVREARVARDAPRAVSVPGKQTRQGVAAVARKAAAGGRTHASARLRAGHAQPVRARAGRHDAQARHRRLGTEADLSLSGFLRRRKRRREQKKKVHGRAKARDQTGREHVLARPPGPRAARAHPDA
mmetsp:Transcript_3193/g.12842  ORF Transcript_3193/g.12842 Transcript_3193/m.12842 type:complete len:325 (-) Transcript_3193:343-1317(-)